MPRFLLLAVLACVGGTYIWAEFASPDTAVSDADSPQVDVRFAKDKATTARAATTKPAGQKTDPTTKTAGKPADKAAARDVASADKDPKTTAASPKPAPTAASPSVIRAAGTPAYSLSRIKGTTPLAAAPDPALVQSTPKGLLPTKGKDGRQPWRVYARPFDAADKRPRIGLVITGLGMNRGATETAVRGLPGAVTLAFAPYGDGLNQWIGKARAAGHEVLLGVPMQPAGYPAFDPGPRALLTSLTPAETTARLHWALGRASGYVGVVDLMGSRFTASRKKMRLVLKDLQQRGLMYLDSRSSSRSAVPEIAAELGLAWATNTRNIDGELSRKAIDARLAELERIAKDDGHAIGMAAPSPLTLERVATWARGLDRRGIVLAPISALSRVGPTG